MIGFCDTADLVGREREERQGSDISQNSNLRPEKSLNRAYVCEENKTW